MPENGGANGFEQILFGFVVGIESAARHAAFVQHVLYAHVAVLFFEQNLGKSVVNFLGCCIDFFVHISLLLYFLR